MKKLTYQSNPYANEPNAAIPFIGKNPEVLPINGTYTVNAGATSVALTDATVANNTLRYYRVTVRDAKANEAVGQFNVSNISAGATVDVSGLDKNTDWTFFVEWAEATSQNEPVKQEHSTQVVTAAKGNAVVTFDWRRLGGTLAVYAELSVDGVVTVANALVADGGTAAFGNVAQNADAQAKIIFKNTGSTPLKVLSIVKTSGAGTVSSDFGKTVGLPLTIATGDTAEYQIANITTSSLGAITPLVVTIGSNDPSNASYVLNFSATIV